DRAHHLARHIRRAGGPGPGGKPGPLGGSGQDIGNAVGAWSRRARVNRLPSKSVAASLYSSSAFRHRFAVSWSPSLSNPRPVGCFSRGTPMRSVPIPKLAIGLAAQLRELRVRDNSPLAQRFFADARHYQIAALATLLFFNVGWLDFGAKPLNSALA